MKLNCLCGSQMCNIGAPNDIEHLLINSYSIEKIQDLVDSEIERNGSVDEWPEHWEQSQALDVWKCRECQRLYVNPNGPAEKVIVYSIEKVGID